jgi:hypothetical protein
VWGGKGWGGKQGEMTQTLYAHMNKIKNLKKEEFPLDNQLNICGILKSLINGIKLEL